MANEFLPFATNPEANVISQGAWSALGARPGGFVSGVAQSAQVNKVLRQAAAMAAAMGGLIDAYSGLDALDDGDIAALTAKIAQTIQGAPWGYAIATGTANAWTVAPTLAVPAYAAGRVLWVKAPATNTSATVTANVSTLGTRPIKKADGSDPAPGDFIVNRWYPTIDDGAAICIVATLASDLEGVAPISRISTSDLFEVFVASGTYTIKSNAIRLIGVGGGGGGNVSVGGGAGGAVDAYLAGLTIGSTISIVIGAGGAGHGGSGSGIAGGNTVISSGTQTIPLITANGGGPASGSSGGVGGLASGGQVNQQGGGGAVNVGGLSVAYSPYGIGGSVSGNGTIVNGSPLIGYFGAQGIATIQALG